MSTTNDDFFQSLIPKLASKEKRFSTTDGQSFPSSSEKWWSWANKRIGFMTYEKM